MGLMALSAEAAPTKSCLLAVPPGVAAQVLAVTVRLF